MSGVLQCYASYQGYMCPNGRYRRSPGLGPESGFVDVFAKDLKNIRIVGRDVPWRTAGPVEVNGFMDIRSWYQAKGTGPGSTTTGGLPPLPAPEGGGLNPFGDLILFTVNDNGGDARPPFIYSDVYVAHSGIEEITQALNDIETHQVGLVRIPISDIRMWYSKCGGLFGSINKRLKSGDWDSTTTKDSSNHPWEIDTVLEYLFSQLPGSPSIEKYSELYQLKGDIDVPSDIIGTGEPVVGWIEKTLDRAGLEAQLTPNNTYVISGKYSTKLAYKEIGGPLGSPLPVPTGGDDEGLHYETQSPTQTMRPPAVVVVGGRRIKRGTFPMIPVLRDVDGQYYKMEDVLNRWGYSLDQVNKQLFLTQDQRFKDVPPTLESGTGGTLHAQRRALLHEAYRIYAPAFMFRDPDSSSSDIPEPDESVPFQPGVMVDPAREFVTYLPIKEAAWYQSEAQAMRNQWPKDKQGKGDLEDYVIMPPIVCANRVEPTGVTNADAIEAHFVEMQAGDLAKMTAINDLLDEYTAKQTRLAVDLQRAADGSKDNISQAALDRFDAKSGQVDLHADTQLAAAAVGIKVQQLPTTFVAIQCVTIEYELAQVAKIVKHLQDQKDKQIAVLANWQTEIAAFKKTYFHFKNLKATYNVPYSALPTGTFNLDTHTGILKSSVPLCLVDKPIWPDGASAKVIADGSVMATWGYELKENNVLGWTTFVFTVSQEDDDTAKPDIVFAGCCKVTPLKAACAKMNGAMYILDAGTPVNFNACYTEAKQKAAAMLRMPRTVTGYSYQLWGLWQAWLDAGVSSVNHEWSNGKGMTHVTVNAPGARIPGGPLIKKPGWVPSIDIREQIEHSKDTNY
jgi:hypothetical protein